MPHQSNRCAKVVFRAGTIFLVVAHFFELSSSSGATLAGMGWGVLKALWDPTNRSYESDLDDGLMGFTLSTIWLLAGWMAVEMLDFLAQARRWLWVIRFLAVGFAAYALSFLDWRGGLTVPGFWLLLIAIFLPLLGLFLIKPVRPHAADEVDGEMMSAEREAVRWCYATRPARRLLWAGFIFFIISQLAVGAGSLEKTGWAFTMPAKLLWGCFNGLVRGHDWDWTEAAAAMTALPFIFIVSAAAWSVDRLTRARPILTLIRGIMMLYFYASPFLIFLILLGLRFYVPAAILPLLCSALLTFIGIFLIPEARDFTE
jgi:hypothetical protein